MKFLEMKYSAVVQQSSSPEAYSPFTLHASPFTFHVSRSANNYFYFLNGHGDVTYFSDTNFNPELIESYEYNPWGVLLTSASKNNLLYTAREFDLETGLQFNRMRYYNIESGMFNYKEPIFTEGNKYCYSCNNPVMISDPQGNLPPWLWPLFIVAIILETGCGGGGEGAYCGSISPTSTETKCDQERKCKKGIAVFLQMNIMIMASESANAHLKNELTLRKES